MVSEKLPEVENNLTISTKLSTDQLICKSPQTESPVGSVRSVPQVIPLKDEGPSGRKEETPLALYYGVLQILFGLLMAVFGVLVLVHNANLSQIGGGLWGGCVSTLTGVIGVLSAARDCCPLKTNPRRLALTGFLALSLISLAIAHLVLALAAIGLARDGNKTNEDEDEETPPDYSTILTGAGLVLVSACECVAAALSAWHCARMLCPCFRPQGPQEGMYSPPHTLTKDMLVSSWLGKHQQPVYVVTTANHKNRMTPISVAPMYPLPTPPPSLLSPPVVGVPLIPAPLLGQTPPPILRPHHHAHTHLTPPDKINKKRRRYPSDRQLQQQQRPVIRHDKSKKQKKSRDKKKTITEAEVAKTYTGLDRVMAEEFIEICDSTRTTSGSDATACTNSDTTSNEFSGERL